MERKNLSKTRKEKEQKASKVDHEFTVSVSQTEQELGKEFTEETELNSPNLSNRGKIKCNRKRKSCNLPDEDVIDGFLILSYGCLEELEADGPIKPGASIAKKTRPSSPHLSAKKGKAKALGKIKKGVLQEKSRKNKENARDNGPEVDERPKKKAKRIKLENSTATKPEQLITEEPDSSDPESKKDVAISPLHVNEITEEPPTALPVSTPPINIPAEQKPKIAHIVEKVSRPEEAPKVLKEITPKKTLSDFSIRAIQGIDTTPSNDNATKSIATMTSENTQNKSFSPPKISERPPLSSSQFNKPPDRKLSSSTSIIGSPSKHGFPYPDKTREGSHVGQFPRLKFTPPVSSSQLHKIPLLQGEEMAEVRQDRRSAAPTMSPDLLRQETHQHQHQHIHQHQHQHQHFHPPYGSMPGHPYGPMYYGPVSVMPVVPPGSHQGMPLHSLKKSGKWCALHVQIARFIAETQKKIEKFSIHKPDPAPSLTSSNRPGSHAFQAVQPRSHGHQERDLSHHFGGHFHSNLNALPNQHHSSPLHSFAARPPEKPGLLSHSLESGHHLPTSLRHSSSARGTELPTFPFGGLSRPYERVPDHDVIAERLSPFRRPRLADLGPPPTPDFGGLGRSSSQSSLFLRRDTDAKLERERSHHLPHSFLDREKPSLFRPSTFDLLDRPSDLRPGATPLGHALATADLKNIGSPPLSKAVTTTQNILRSMKLYDKNFPERPTDHQSLFHKEKARDLGLFGSRSRIGGPLTHSGLISNLGLGSSRPHLPSS